MNNNEGKQRKDRTMSANMTCDGGNTQSKLSAMMDVCENQADELHLIIARLADHLSIVMISPEPKPSPEPSVIGEKRDDGCRGRSPATATIEGIANTISRANDVLNGIIGRLDV